MTYFRWGIKQTYSRGKSVQGSGKYASPRSCMIGVQCVCFVLYSLVGLTYNSQPCLTWQIDDDALHLICRLNDSSKSVSFLDKFNNEQVVCSLNGSAYNCTYSLDGLTSHVNISRYTAVLTILTTDAYTINGTWTCRQGRSMYTTEVSKSKGIIDSTDMQIKGKTVKISGIYSAVQLVCFSCIEPDRYIAEFLIDNRSVDSVRYNVASHKCYHFNGQCREDVTCSCSVNSFTRTFNLTDDRTPTYYSCEMIFKDSGKSSKFSKHATLFFNGSDLVDMKTRTTVIVKPKLDDMSFLANENSTGSGVTQKSVNKENVGAWVGTSVAVLIIVLIFGSVIYVCVRSANRNVKDKISRKENICLLPKHEVGACKNIEDLKVPTDETSFEVPLPLKCEPEDKCTSKEYLKGLVDEQTSTDDLVETTISSELEYAQTDCAKITKQEINYLLVVHLVTCLAVSTVRHVFDKEFYPGRLTDIIKKNTNTLEKLRQKNRITKTQFYLLTKDSSLTSEKLDLQLMICLLRNIGPKFEITDELPAPNRRTVVANLSKIKYYRKAVLCNHNHGTLSDEQFTKIWKDLCKAIQGLNEHAFENNYSTNEDDKVDATDAVSKALTEKMQNETRFSRVRTMTNEEIYHLRIIHLLYRVVFQAVRFKFDSIFPSSHPFKILDLSSNDFRNILQHNKRNKTPRNERCVLIRLDALCQEKDAKAKQNTRKFNLTLMIELLLSQRIYCNIEKKEYTALSELLLLCHKMARSEIATFTREKFDTYWKTISTSVTDLVGETHKKIFEKKFYYLDPARSNI
ncbi:uncharacterized protein LOC127704681 isoform X2 [Mytilus californianus]|uniref:uncharacterized protein LOC127704681 isoform X2 n=1 Tax=Mytilus californianus TaxID=6549 RepID=UPI002247C7E3|nr:uncharacterized protein LOC127704681 isoform X2 [Mytilus californianus]